jgi:mannose-6-phosphate isomerase-like protein (cupin superfamily)
MSSTHAPAASLEAPARDVWWYGGKVGVKLTAAQTDGRTGMWLWEAGRGATAPLHVHEREDEFFLVVEGTARFVRGEERIEARAGDLVVLPRGVPHAYLITSETARVVGMASPGGFESFFTELGTPVVPGEPPAAPPEPERMARTAAAHGVEIIGPPPALD